MSFLTAVYYAGMHSPISPSLGEPNLNLVSDQANFQAWGPVKNSITKRLFSKNK